MKFYVGQKLIWTPYYKWMPKEDVTVVSVQKHGCAKLSNGWVVDVNGVAEGTARMRGGSVQEMCAE